MASTARFASRRVVMLGYPHLVLLDVVGPCEVFSMANRLWRKRRPGTSDPYAIEIVSVSRGMRFRASSGLVLLADRHWTECRGPIDTLLVPGGVDLKHVTGNAALLQWLRTVSAHARRVGSICTGAFVLAAAGLLEGRSATTHWEGCQQLAREYPGIRVDSDRIYIKDGNVYTSAGVTAGMDLALALVEEDLGRELALKVAQILVMFVRRPGGLSQFSALLRSQAAERQPLRDLLVWAAEHPDEDLSVEALAARVNMSVRNFSRAFRRGLGETPARFVEMLRVEAAQRMLEESDVRLDQVAEECGLGSCNSLRRSFLRLSGVSPSVYRHRFRRT